VIKEELPTPEGIVSNSDPVTGQAGWYDVRVRIYRASIEEPAETWPHVAAVGPLSGVERIRRTWQAFVAGRLEGR
jgi:hypothetical protein